MSFSEFLNTTGIAVEFSEVTKYPIYVKSETLIVLRQNIDALESIATAHEFAHALQHALNYDNDSFYAESEVSAESVAQVICKHFNVDFDIDESNDYIRHWLVTADYSIALTQIDEMTNLFNQLLEEGV